MHIFNWRIFIIIYIILHFIILLLTLLLFETKISIDKII